MSKTQNMSPTVTMYEGLSTKEKFKFKDFKNLISNQRLTLITPKDRGPLKVADPSLPTRARGQRHGPRRMDVIRVIRGLV